MNGSARTENFDYRNIVRNTFMREDLMCILHRAYIQKIALESQYKTIKESY